MPLRVEKITEERPDVISYLEKNLNRNALDIWNLRFENQRFELHICTDEQAIKAHLGIYRTPEASYVSVAGQKEAIQGAFSLIPGNAVVTVPPELYETVRDRIRFDAVYPNDLMIVSRGEEKLVNADVAVRLSQERAFEYSGFGSSFNLPPIPLQWAEECLKKDMIFGVSADGKLVSVASVVARLPQVAVIMGVETKKEFRRLGYGTRAVSAATREALKHSSSCELFVRSDNREAIRIYEKLGFRKIGEEFVITIGTTFIP